MSPLLRLVYVSSATELFTDDALTALLEQSRERNARDGITGMLLYQEGNFLQLIEGPETAVRALHARILKDRRHHKLITVLEESVTDRECAQWSMGFVPEDRLREIEREAFSPLLVRGGDAAPAPAPAAATSGALGAALRLVEQHWR